MTRPKTIDPFDGIEGWGITPGESSGGGISPGGGTGNIEVDYGW